MTEGSAEGAPEGDDPELAAGHALHLRIQRARRRASFGCLFSGLLLGVVLVFALQSTFEDELGGRFAAIALFVVFFAPLLGALKVAEVVSDWVVRRGIRAWIDALAKEHGVSTGALEDHARVGGVSV